MSTDLESRPLVTDANGYVVETPAPPADGGDLWPIGEVPPHLRGLADDVHRAKAAWQSARAATKAAKNAYEAALDTLIDAMNPPGDAVPVSTMDDAPDAWRRVTTRALGLHPGTVKILAESGITTLGHIADWTANDRPLTDIPKIGQSKANAIEDAANAWWAKHPPMAAEAPPDDPEQPPVV